MNMDDIFSQFGPILGLNMKNGYAFVEFEDVRDADDAQKEMNGYKLDNQRISVEFATGTHMNMGNGPNSGRITNEVRDADRSNPSRSNGYNDRREGTGTRGSSYDNRNSYSSSRGGANNSYPGGGGGYDTVSSYDNRNSSSYNSRDNYNQRSPPRNNNGDRGYPDRDSSRNYGGGYDIRASGDHYPSHDSDNYTRGSNDNYHSSRNYSDSRGGGGRGGYRGGGGYDGKNSKYSPPRNTDFRLIVKGNSVPHCSWQDLKDHFRAAGDVCFADIRREFGIIEYKYEDDMLRAIRELDGTLLRGDPISVKEDVNTRRNPPRDERTI